MRRTGKAIGTLAAATSLAMVGGGMAFADQINSDSDGDSLATVESSKSLGTEVAPGASLEATARFILACSTRNHVDATQSVNLAKRTASLTSGGVTTNVTNGVTAANATLSRAENWPADGTACPAGLTTSATTSAISFAAPDAAGEYSLTIVYSAALSTPGSNDPQAITGGAPSVTYTFTVVEPEDIDADDDGIADDEDNCVNDENADQADLDEDGVGDVCDLNSYAPQVDEAAADAFGDEGSELKTSGSFSDADGNDLTVSIVDNANETPSAGEIVDNGDGSWSWSHTSGDNDSGDVTVEVSDGEYTETDTFSWTADNVAPSLADGAGVTAGGSGLRDSFDGNVATLEFSIGDAGIDDTHEVSVDWGDGSQAEVLVEQTSRDYSVNHTYNKAGTSDVTVTVTDNDGDSNGGESAGGVRYTYKLGAIQSPINADGTSVFKIGSTIPVKVSLLDAKNRVIGVSGEALALSLKFLGTSSLPTVNEVTSTSSADSGTNLRYSAPQYMYNLSTSKMANGDKYEVTVTATRSDILDATSVQQKFGTKK